MKIIIAAMLSMGILSHAFAQQLPGLLPNALNRHSKYSFDLGQENKLLVYARTVQDLQKFQNIDSVLTHFAKDYSVLKTSLSESINSKTVTYRPLPNAQYQLDLVEHVSPKQRFQFKTNGGEPLLLKTVQDTLLIIHSFLKPMQTKAGQVTLSEYVYFCLIVNNLEDTDKILMGGGLNVYLKKAIKDAEKYPNHNLLSGKFKFNYVQSNSVEGSFKTVASGNEDFLAIHPSFGVGVFRNQLVPNSQVDFSFVPNKYKNIGYTIGWRSMFFTDRNDVTQRITTHSNGFVHAGITFYDFRRPQPSRINTDHVLFGAYLGRSVTRNGAIFDKNTWNFSMTVAAKGMFKVQPEIYFNGFFKNVQPGLRIQIGY
ncbi:hypothetical protein [Runella slithyformis]|uniref:Uncharacterized protein n=1 Tax=Runella slithyformis (strain ATCC 29530 / DSM 19594 / LMG 11500 / NCIMB 11436 / LSU 4) TaxID=761193 RepID=A0A7U3ZFZ5_RUNSL|nr:hypothetical protein [Runella slithyformis]AEI46475.1 hypothetical protein Runsl_0015 [Runella slithyformis DSM 19594]